MDRPRRRRADAASVACVVANVVPVLVALVALVAMSALTGCGAMHHLVDDEKPPPRASAGDIVWQVTYWPGFTTPTIMLTTRPSVTVYGDGWFIVRPPDPHADPSAVVTFEEGRLSATELATLEATVADSHVFDEGTVDLGNPGVMDAGTTTVRGLGPDGHVVELDAYALDVAPTDLLTDQQADLREAVDDLIDDVHPLVPDVDLAEYEPERLAVYSLDAYGPGDDAPPENWPGPSHDELFAGQSNEPACASISGPAVEPILHAAQTNPGHDWLDPDGGTFRAVVVIAIPGMPACPR